MSVLYTPVLKLNKNWQPIGECNVRKAIEDLSAGAVTAIYIKNGEFSPLRWRDWLNLKIQADDEVIHSPRMPVKVPRVVVCVNFDKLFVDEPKLNIKNLRERDNDTCILTGRKLKPCEMSMEHIIPESQNGPTTWENIGLCHRDVNSKRGNMSYERFGKQPLWKPFAPRAKKPEEKIENRFNYPEWEFFLKKKKK